MQLRRRLSALLGDTNAHPLNREPKSSATRIDPDLATMLAAMFPSDLATEVRSVIEVLEAGPRNDHFERPPFFVEGERLQLVTRFYSPEPAPATLAALSPSQRIILACLYSRHYEGRVRESYLRELVGDEAWLPVFILRLVSEYVVEIGQVALDHIDAVPRRRYRAFASENPTFMTTTRARIISYHNEYYRKTFDLTAYPPYRFLDSLGLWPRDIRRR